MVYVYDSLGTWHDSVMASSSGAYSFTIPATLAYPTGLTVSSSGCSAVVTAHLFYKGSSLRQNLITCGTSKYISVSVMQRNPTLVSATGPFVVYLIRRDVDPVTFDTTLTAIDSNYNISYYPGYTYFERPCVPSGKYLIKAALLPANTAYTSWLPTYHDSSLNWSNADTLTHAQLLNSGVNVYLVGGSNPGGPGFIGGSVLVGANKTTAVGDPLSSRILILTNAATGKPVAYTYSNASGNFQFPNLAYGTYKIFGDAGGKKNPPLAVTLSAAQKTVSNIVFEENNKKFEGHFNNVGIGRVNNLPGVSVFPNPVTDFVGVQGLSSIGGDKTIVLSSMTGAEISRQTVSNDASISTATLPSGIYLLQVQTEAGSASFRIVK